MSNSEIINEINNLSEYGYQESDIFNMLKDKSELSEYNLRITIKSSLIESFLILKSRKLDEESMSNSLIKNFLIEDSPAYNISNQFYSNNFSNLHSMIEENLYNSL